MILTVRWEHCLREFYPNPILEDGKRELAEIRSDKEIYVWAWHVTAFMNPLIFIKFCSISSFINIFENFERTLEFIVNFSKYSEKEALEYSFPYPGDQSASPHSATSWLRPAGNRRFVILPDNTALIYLSSIVFPCLRICRCNNPLQESSFKIQL